MPGIADSENPFWDWSLRVYAKRSVAESCLALQERYGTDVNLLLLAAYLALQQKCWTESSLRTYVRAVDAWRSEVLLPLRAARQAARRLATATPLYTALKDAELMAERQQQDLLWAALLEFPPQVCRGDALQHNLAVLAGAAFTDPAWRCALAALRSQ